MARRLLITLAVLVALGFGTAFLIRFSLDEATEFRVDAEEIHISGPLTGATTDRFERLLDAHPEITRVVLRNIPGGDDLSWLLGMADLIAARGLATRADGAVTNDAIFLFLAGSAREIGSGRLHLLSQAMARETGAPWDQGAAAVAERAEAARAFLGAPDFALFMGEMQAANDAYDLTEADLVRFGLLTE
ncbi:MAG: hypothetical protein AAGA70_04790 [Pseudomonadota bacterium]